jgi:hypothetical protein
MINTHPVLFLEGQKVLVHSLGESHPGEYRGIVRGIYGNIQPFYIVEMVDKIRKNDYSCMVIIGSCVKADGEVI